VPEEENSGYTQRKGRPSKGRILNCREVNSKGTLLEGETVKERRVLDWKEGKNDDRGYGRIKFVNALKHRRDMLSTTKGKSPLLLEKKASPSPDTTVVELMTNRYQRTGKLDKTSRKRCAC